MDEFLKEYYHKGFGYKYEDNKLIIARIDNYYSESLNTVIKENDKFKNFEVEKKDDYYYIKIDINDYKKINSFLNKLLKQDITFTLCKQKNVEFNGLKDIFSEELVELKYINKYYIYKAQGYNYNYIRNKYIPDSFFKIWNWSTTEGKAFCIMIRSKDKRKTANYESKNNYMKKYKKYLDKLGIKYKEKNEIDEVQLECVDFDKSKGLIMDKASNLVLRPINDGEYETIGIYNVEKNNIYKLNNTQREYAENIGISINDSNAISEENELILFPYKHTDNKLYLIEIKNKLIFEERDQKHVLIGQLKQDKMIHKLNDDIKKYASKLNITVDDSNSY